MKNFKQLIITVSLLLSFSFAANAGQTVVGTNDLGEDNASGTVRVVLTLTDVFVSSNETKNTDVGIILHQAGFTGWNDGVALCMLQLMAADSTIELKGYNASAWGDDIVKIERNKQVALWLSYDADADTHGLSYQIEGETAPTALYADYGNRALPKSAANDFSRFCTVAYNNNFTADGCVVVNDSAKFVDAIEAYTFEGGSASLNSKKANAAVKVQPTVAQNEINISCDKAIANVAILSIGGIEMMSVANTNTVDVSSLNAGMYFVKTTTTDGAVAIQKIMKK